MMVWVYITQCLKQGMGGFIPGSFETGHEMHGVGDWDCISWNLKTSGLG